MKVLAKWYTRFIISIFSFGIISEIISISKGENYEAHPMFSFVYIFGMYFGLSVAYGFHLIKKDKLNNTQ